MMFTFGIRHDGDLVATVRSPVPPSKGCVLRHGGKEWTVLRVVHEWDPIGYKGVWVECEEGHEARPDGLAEG